MVGELFHQLDLRALPLAMCEPGCCRRRLSTGRQCVQTATFSTGSERQSQSAPPSLILEDLVFWSFLPRNWGIGSQISVGVDIPVLHESKRKKQVRWLSCVSDEAQDCKWTCIAGFLISVHVLEE